MQPAARLPPCPALIHRPPSITPLAQLLQPAPGRRRTVLLFVFRDRTKTPLEKLVETWEADLGRMWESIAKPPQYEESALTDFFELQYAAMSNYEDRQEEFLAEAVLLRRKFTEDSGALWPGVPLGGCGWAVKGWVEECVGSMMVAAAAGSAAAPAAALCSFIIHPSIHPFN